MGSCSFFRNAKWFEKSKAVRRANKAKQETGKPIKTGETREELKVRQDVRQPQT